MPRPWEYARWRRVARQAVLCAGLGLTVVLAWWIGHARAAGLRVELGPLQTFDNKILPLELRLPPSPAWALNAELEYESVRLDASEQTSRYHTHRVLTLVLQRLHPTGGVLLTPEEVIGQEMSKWPGGHKEKLDFLGHPGVLIEYPAEPGAHPLPAVLYACTVVPSPAPTAIRIWMESPFDFSPADTDLIKRFAQSLSPVNPAHHAPPIPIADLKPRETDTMDTTDSDNGN